MTIFTTSPTIIPASTLDKLWASNISIQAPVPDGNATARVTLVPYNDAGVVGSKIEMLSIKDIIGKAELDPESNMAKAMHFLLLAIGDEYGAQQDV
jgi:hypothetical protein